MITNQKTGKDILREYLYTEKEMDRLVFEHRIMIANSKYSIRDKREISEKVAKCRIELNKYKELLANAIDKDFETLKELAA